MADIAHEIKIEAPVERVFAALSTPEGMQGWHTSQVEGTGEVGSVWQLGFEGKPSFSWEVLASEPGVRVDWRCTAGPGNSPGTEVEYVLSSLDDGRTLVEQRHTGWDEDDDSFRACNTLWGVLLHHLRDYAESEQAAPAFS